MKEWWEPFFSGAWLAIWQQVKSEKETAKEADFRKVVLQFHQVSLIYVCNFEISLAFTIE